MAADHIVPLNYKSYGSGPPMIILHGLFGMSDNWKTIAQHLSEHFTVYLLDLRNHGRSPHSNAFSYPLMADDVLHFMDDHWMHQDVIIMGHSMGGKVAMHCVLKEEDRFKAMVSVDMSPREQPGKHLHILKAMLSLDVDALDSREAANDHLEKSGIHEWPVRQFLLKNLKRNRSGGYRWKMNLGVLNEKYTSVLEGVVEEVPLYSGPAAFIKGSVSNYIREEDEDQIRELFPEASFYSVEGAGHWVHADKPELFLDAVLDFVGSL